ncbi:MAG: nucleoside hydrolase [Acidimicrobiia bacterium]|nr:nucleoside hydrolase [Acidimicrobiia bacterium]
MAVSRQIIIDTDPGQDDAFALLLAWAAPEELEILGITTVAGNVTVDKTTHNALRLRDLAGAATPILRGCSRPLVNELVTAEYVHGDSGLDGPDLPDPRSSVESMHAVDFLVQTLRAATEPITVCVLGPMTNLAMALIMAPDIVAGIDQFVIMGGSFRAGGNVTPAAEFNVFVDPHAVHVVLTSGVPLVVMPLDVTHQAQAVPHRVSSLRELDTPVGKALIEMLEFVERHDITHGFEGFPLHDPTVIAYLLEPELFELRPGRISVVLDSGPDHGRTVGSWRSDDDTAANGEVAFGIDADRYFELLAERLATF